MFVHCKYMYYVFFVICTDFESRFRIVVVADDSLVPVKVCKLLRYGGQRPQSLGHRLGAEGAQ